MEGDRSQDYFVRLKSYMVYGLELRLASKPKESELLPLVHL